MMDQHYFLLLCVASITLLIGFGRSEAAAATAGAPPTADETKKQDEALEQLFLAIDSNRDGIIKLNELTNLEENEDFCALIKENDQRKVLLELLRGACGIDMASFKALFHEHFTRQANFLQPIQNQGNFAVAILKNLLRPLTELAGRYIASFGFGQSVETANYEQDQALEQLFLVIDENGDGLIKIDELEKVVDNPLLQGLVQNNDKRTKVIELLKAACGIDINTFKTLFHEHFKRQVILPPKESNPTRIQQLAGILTNFLSSWVETAAKTLAAIGVTNGESQAATQTAATAEDENGKILEQLFLVIDEDKDGIIKINELQEVVDSTEIRQLITDDAQREMLFNLLKAACGIDINTFKTLFHTHFNRQILPPQLQKLYEGRMSYLAGALGGLLTSLFSKTPAPSNAK